MSSNNKYYVSMTDKFMSEWGKAKDKINKLVIECDTYGQASIVANNAKDRGEMIYISIHDKKPYYNGNRYLTTYHDKGDYSRWFDVNRPFKKEV